MDDVDKAFEKVKVAEGQLAEFKKTRKLLEGIVDIDRSYNEETQVLGVYLVRALKAGSVAVLCPKCFGETHWAPPNAPPRFCGSCGKRVAVRLERRSEEECQRTTSSVKNAEQEKPFIPSAMKSGGEMPEPAPVDPPCGESSQSEPTSSSVEEDGHLKENIK